MQVERQMSFRLIRADVLSNDKADALHARFIFCTRTKTSLFAVERTGMRIDKLNNIANNPKYKIEQ